MNNKENQEDIVRELIIKYEKIIDEKEKKIDELFDKIKMLEATLDQCWDEIGPLEDQ